MYAYTALKESSWEDKKYVTWKSNQNKKHGMSIRAQDVNKNDWE